jgi:hypothetical protein
VCIAAGRVCGVDIGGFRAAASFRASRLGGAKLFETLLGGERRDARTAQVPSDLHAVCDHDQHMIPVAC